MLAEPGNNRLCIPQRTQQYQLDICIASLKHNHDTGPHTDHADKTCDFRGLNSRHYSYSYIVLRRSWHAASELKDMAIV